jgi:hypothetical protein
MAPDLLSLLTPLRRGRAETDAWTGDPALAPEVLPSLDAVRPETLRRLGVLPDGSAVYIVLGWLRTALAAAPVPPPDEPHVVLLRVTRQATVWTPAERSMLGACWRTS